MTDQVTIDRQVPPLLMERVARPEVLIQMLPHYLSHLPLDTAVGFIDGAMHHQELLAEDNQIVKGQSNVGWKWMKVRVLEVNTIERRVESSGKLIGKKAQLVLDSTREVQGKTEQETIDTDWVEYHFGDAASQAFEIAVARTIRDLALATLGQEILLCKYVEAGGSKGNIRKVMAAVLPAGQSVETDDDDDAADAPRGPEGEPGLVGDGYADAYDAVQEAVEKYDEGQLANAEDIAELQRIVIAHGDSDQDGIWDEIAVWLQVDQATMEDIPNAADFTTPSWAVQVFLANLPE